MGYTFYAYQVLLDQKSTFDLQQLADRLTACYRKDKRQVNIHRSNQKITLQIANYCFTIALNLSEAVQEEATDLAINYLRHKRKQKKLAACTKRLDIRGEVDLEMSYFNDSLTLLDEISYFKGTHIFDPQAGTFLDEM